MHTGVGTWAWRVQGLLDIVVLCRIYARTYANLEEQAQARPSFSENQKGIALHSNPKQVCKGELVRVTGSSEVFWS